MPSFSRGLPKGPIRFCFHFGAEVRNFFFDNAWPSGEPFPETETLAPRYFSQVGIWRRRNTSIFPNRLFRVGEMTNYEHAGWAHPRAGSSKGGLTYSVQGGLAQGWARPRVGSLYSVQGGLAEAV